MKTSKIIAVVALVVASFTGVHAASFVVSPGQSIQEAINAASAGDNITVQTGNYNENLTIGKGLDIRGAGGAVLVTGTLTITNVTTPVYIADISFGKSGTSGITVTGSSNVRFDRINLVENGHLSATNSTFYSYKCNFRTVQFAGCTWTLQRTNVSAGLNSSVSTAKLIASTVTSNFGHSNGELTVFQSNLRELCDVALTASQKSWICYNSVRCLQISGGTSEVVGNWMDGRDRNDFFIQVRGGAVTIIRNNRLWNDGRFTYEYGGSGVVVLGDAGMTRIYNNTIRDVARGFTVSGSPAGVEIRGNIHRDVPYSAEGGPISMNTPYAGTIISHNNFQYGVGGGVQSNNINVDAQFGANDVLGASSPSRNAGPTDAIFNDIDGSRNDQGAYGGHSYDPEGRTTLKPVVLSGDVSPLYVKRGGAVTVRARAAVAAAP